MNRLKEKLKAIYHIITDKEYIVFTVTLKNNKRKNCAAFISDNASRVFINNSIEYLKEQ